MFTKVSSVSAKGLPSHTSVTKISFKIKILSLQKNEKIVLFLSKNSTEIKKVIYKIQSVLRWKNGYIFPQSLD